MRLITETQCRTARALLNWSQTDLAKKSNLSESTIRDFEKGRRVPSPNNLAAIIAAFGNAGVVLLDDGQHAGIGGEGARFSEDASGKKLENEKAVLEKELGSAKSVYDYLVEQIATSDEMKNNFNFRRLLMQAESEVASLHLRIKHIEARLAGDARRVNFFAEQIHALEEENDDPKDL